MDAKMRHALLVLLLWFTSTNTQLYSTSKTDYRRFCPHLYQRTFRGYVPRGNLSAGIYTEVEGVTALKSCVMKCCVDGKCNVAFMMDAKCYHVACTSNELCVPTPSENVEPADRVAMVLVQPTDEDTWEDVLGQQDAANENSLNREMLSVFTNPQKLEDMYKDLLMDGSNTYSLTGCTVGIDTCLPNEECVQNYPKSRAGTCKCRENFERNLEGDCVSVTELRGLTDSAILVPNGGNATVITKKQLTITAESKEVKLPNDEVTLVASVAPSEPGDEEKYQFEWTSLQQPDGSTAVKHQNGGQLQLSKLSEGLYTFKVSASSADAYGETFVNVTVLPPSRINKPPQVVITPANQTVKLPNTGAVLDASSSTDDDGIVSWHWELQQGPLGYQPDLQDSPTLQLNDLTRPGNYTFKLTVTDSDQATSWGVANVTVLKVTDYPPEANAGEDKIIYLPHNKITLNGNLSTDDHAITTWEWTKSPGDADKAVDMQDTRTPYLQLSNLEEGVYTFTLKVTDSANQSSTAEVHVFVKPPTNQPPVAEAGGNITISLPQTWVVLDGRNSTDDNKIVDFKWEQVDGPSATNIQAANETKTNVTGLTKGGYTFKLTVTDDNQNKNSDLVYVTVNQNKNQKPKANAGGDFEISLPRNVVTLNGTASSDDWAVTRWRWTRHETSLAVGNIAEKSDETPLLQLTDLVVGRYVFNLTVYDEQGLSDTDIVSFVVKSDPKLYYLVEITLEEDVKVLKEAQYETLKGKLALLVQDGTQLQVRGLKPEKGTEKAVISFYVETSDGKPLPANDVVDHLRQKLKVDASLLGFRVASLKTTVCQNNCSGHGVCNEQTRDCICEAFWMRDLFKAYFEEGDADCSWSILYVVLGVTCALLLFVGLIWSVTYFCMRWCSKRNMIAKPSTYKLIEDTDDLPPYASRKSNLSDSDTDSDVVFESRNKSTSRFSNGDSRNGHKPRNGFTKMGRRVKT